MKKFICGLLVGFMLAIGVTTYAVPEIKSAVFSPDIKLVVNGKQVDSEVVSVVTTDKPGYMTNYVPARALSEALGATVTWDGKAKAINVSTDETATVSSVSAPAPTTKTTPKTNPDIPYPVYKVDDSGLTVYDIQNGYLYGIFSLDVQNALKSKGYIMNNAADNKTMQIVGDDSIIVTGIVTRQISGKTYISYDFYLEHIKPLLQ